MRQVNTAALFMALTLGSAWAQDQPQEKLPAVELTAGMHRIVAEVAATPQQQMIGLMHRRDMGANEGMLFVYEASGQQCFWMRNTLLPLTIAFIDDDGRIVNLADMQPMTEASHCSAKPVRFTLEMHQGWFAKRGLKAGSRLRGAPFKP
ncbi:MAG: DUF192 domain-containing protein [Rubrivivax sp.]|nr:DUF192 domain-containing protein [Rubrivivax sp.]